MCGLCQAQSRTRVYPAPFTPSRRSSKQTAAPLHDAALRCLASVLAACESSQSTPRPPGAVCRARVLATSQQAFLPDGATDDDRRGCGGFTLRRPRRFTLRRTTSVLRPRRARARRPLEEALAAATRGALAGRPYTRTPSAARPRRARGVHGRDRFRRRRATRALHSLVLDTGDAAASFRRSDPSPLQHAFAPGPTPEKAKEHRADASRPRRPPRRPRRTNQGHRRGRASKVPDVLAAGTAR